MARGRDLVQGAREQLEAPLLVGAAVAVGYARGSGKVGVATVDDGPALATELAEARNARAPLILIASEPIEGAATSGLLKATHHVQAVDELPLALLRAVRDATMPPAGPVALVVSEATLDAPTDACPPRINPIGTATRGDELELARGAALLAGAENPIVLAGDGVGLGDAWPELVALAERLGAPVVTEPSSTAWNFPNRHPLWQGETLEVGDADVALACGLNGQPSMGNARTQVVDVTDDPGALARHPAVVAGILGDVKLNLTALGSALRATSQPRSAFGAANRRRAALAEHAAQRAQLWAELVVAARQEPRVTATALAAELAELLPHDALLCLDLDLDDGRDAFLNLLEFTSPLSCSRLSAPAARGLHLARPRQIVVSVARSCLIVFQGGDEAETATERVTALAELRPALERALSTRRPYVLDVPI